MKQKTTLITILLAVSVLILGIAYAALASQTLSVTGSASIAISNENFKVQFMEGSVVSKSDGVTGSVAVTGDLSQSATITVGNMTTKNQTATFKLPIKNTTPTEADVKAVLQITATGVNNEWFDVSASLDNEQALSPSEIANLTVIVKLKKTPITQADIDAVNGTESTTSQINKINITVSATPQ